MDKKSFILYLDIEENLQDLSDSQLGHLLRLLFAFARTGELQGVDDPAVKIAYRFITAQMRRDSEKYDIKCLKNSENARKGGAPRGNRNAAKSQDTKNNRSVEKTTETSERLKKQPKQPYNDNENDNENDIFSLSFDNENNTEQDCTAPGRAAQPAQEKNVIPWDEIDFELV